MLERCERWARSFGLRGLTEVLRTVGGQAIKGLIKARMEGENKSGKLGWRFVEEAYHFIGRWCAFDPARRPEAFSLVSQLDLARIPQRVFANIIAVSPLVSEENTIRISEAKVGVQDTMDVQYGLLHEHGTTELSGVLRSVALHAGTVAVADALLGGIWLADAATGAWQQTVGSLGCGPGQFRGAYGVAFNATGQMYASDASLKKVMVFSEGTYEYMHDIDFAFSNPSALACSPQGDLIVLDGDEVLVFRQGLLLHRFAGFGSAEGMLLAPRGVCVGADGNIFVADYGNCRFQIFDHSGVFLRSVVHAHSIGIMVRPSGIALGSGGEIVVSDCKRGDVYVFRADGESVVQKISYEGDSIVCLHKPYGLAVGEEGRIFVTDECCGQQPNTTGRLLVLGF
jgi:hypothetical protein